LFVIKYSMRTALGIIIEGNKVLIGKTKKEKLNEYSGLEYVFPSVQPLEDENIEAALIVEIKEQSNLDISIVSKIGERKHPISGNWTEYFHCRIIPPQALKISDNADIGEFIWIELQDVSKLYALTFYRSERVLIKVF
jgi:hypothetical protein